MRFLGATSLAGVQRRWLLLTSSLILLGALSCLPGVRASAFGDVAKLDHGNLTTFADGRSRNVLVAFYAPWCSFSRKLAPKYARVAEALSEHDDALVAGFDCEAFEKAQKEMTWASSFKYKHLCEEGYPSLVLFPKLYVESQGYGDDVDNEKMKRYEYYRGPPRSDDMLTFFNQQTGTRAHLRPPPSAIKELTPENFRLAVSNEDSFVFVNFYSPGCPFCEVLNEHWERLAETFAPEGDSVVIAQLNAEEFKEYALNYDISGFPTLKWFPKGRSVETRDGPESALQYNLEPTFDTLLAFVNDKAGTNRVPGGGLAPEVGTHSGLDKLARKVLAGEEAMSRLHEMATEVGGEGADAYAKFVERALERGHDYLDKQLLRLQSLSNSKAVTPQKRTSFQIRQNVLARIVDAAGGKAELEVNVDASLQQA